MVIICELKGKLYIVSLSFKTLIIRSSHLFDLNHCPFVRQRWGKTHKMSDMYNKVLLTKLVKKFSATFDS
jgi:hypothetical protein